MSDGLWICRPMPQASLNAQSDLLLGLGHRRPRNYVFCLLSLGSQVDKLLFTSLLDPCGDSEFNAMNADWFCSC